MRSSIVSPRTTASAFTAVPASTANAPSIRPPAVITAFTAGYFLARVFFLPATVRLGPLRVRALVFVR